MPAAFANFFKKNNQSSSKEPEAKGKKSLGTPKKKGKKQEGMFCTIKFESFTYYISSLSIKSSIFLYTVDCGEKINLPLKASQKDSLLATAMDSPSKRKGLNLSSTSLILFEEVLNNALIFILIFWQNR